MASCSEEQEFPSATKHQSLWDILPSPVLGMVVNMFESPNKRVNTNGMVSTIQWGSALSLKTLSAMRLANRHWCRAVEENLRVLQPNGSQINLPKIGEKFPNLTELDLYNMDREAQIKGHDICMVPRDYGVFQPLKKLRSLKMVNLMQEEVASIGALNGIRHVDVLFSTEFNVACKCFLQALTSLRTLFLEFGGPVEDDTLLGLTNLQSLEELSLCYVGTPHTIPLSHLGAVSTLTCLKLTRCLSGMNTGSLEFLSNLNKLKYLGLRGCTVTDSMLANLAHLTNLNGLDLSSCKEFTGTGLTALWELTKLSVLNLYDSSIRDANLKIVGQTRSLRHLNLGSCHFIMDDGVRELTRLENLRELKLIRCESISFASVRAFEAMEGVKVDFEDFLEYYMDMLY